MHQDVTLFYLISLPFLVSLWECCKANLWVQCKNRKFLACASPSPLEDISKPFDTLFPIKLWHQGSFSTHWSRWPVSVHQFSVNSDTYLPFWFRKTGILGDLYQKWEVAFRPEISPSDGQSEVCGAKGMERGLSPTNSSPNSLWLTKHDPVSCTLLVSNECLIDGICVLFNLPLIAVKDERAKESIKMKSSWLLTVMVKTSQIYEFSNFHQEFIDNVFFSRYFFTDSITWHNKRLSCSISKVTQKYFFLF